MNRACELSSPSRIKRLAYTIPRARHHVALFENRHLECTFGERAGGFWDALGRLPFSFVQRRTCLGILRRFPQLMSNAPRPSLCVPEGSAQWMALCEKRRMDPKMIFRVSNLQSLITHGQSSGVLTAELGVPPLDGVGLIFSVLFFYSHP